MKTKYISTAVIATLIFLGASCSTSTTTTTTTTSEPSVWEGTWILESETIQTPVGPITSPITNKILVIDSDLNMTEDYSQLEGLDNPASPIASGCTSTGEITSTLTTDSNTNTATVSTGTTVTEPKIDCGVAGTSAVPRSLTVMDWALGILSDGQTMTATATFGPSQATHTYVKQ